MKHPLSNCIVFSALALAAQVASAQTYREPVNHRARSVKAPIVSDHAGHRIARFDHDAWIGSMWQPDDGVDEVVIGRNATVTGSILVPSSRTKPLTIRGEDRHTSRLVGTGTFEWNREESDLSRRHSAIFVDTTRPVTIRTLTSLNPDKYHFVGYNHTQLIVEDADIIDDRLAYTTDGIGGGRGTTVRNVFIDTYDDGIKVYAPDMVIEDVTIVHNRNGAPLQFGWGGEQGSATIRNLTVIANEPQIYNQGVFARAAQRGEKNARPLAGSAKVEGFRLIVPEGKRSPPLFMWGTPDGQQIKDFTLTVEGLCSGAEPTYRQRGDFDVVERGNSDKVRLVTPDCR
ncbi:Dextranase precursor [Tsuneonella dongtanensis]|uniref:Dextranase n=1 Tax=Tsuneonella dongtanensis TaxID=692370 RepID=A0A1B2ABD0_9SPHN|nr:hypothetical protein [Tsuneonella dongtanensis]ANY19355.1 Dextranase precursor [Tsuneonella dongtanensis]